MISVSLKRGWPTPGGVRSTQHNLPDEAGLDTRAATLIRDAAARDLFSLLGDPLPQDGALGTVASKLLRAHLRRVATGDLEPADSTSHASANVTVLGTLSGLERELARSGTLHGWGHFIAPPAAHAEAVAGFTAHDGVTRVYIATAWRV